MNFLKALIKEKVTKILFAKIDHISEVEVKYDSKFFTGMHLVPDAGGEKLGAIINSDETLQTGKHYLFAGYYIEYEETEIFYVTCLKENATQQSKGELVICSDHQAYLNRLNDIVSSIKNKTTRKFLDEVFDLPEILILFAILLASSNHHHSYKFGLIEHSLGCGEFERNALKSYDNKDEVDTCISACLLHDIGKIKTLQEGEKLTSFGVYVQHDSLTLYILYPFLKKMETEWPMGAAALMYIVDPIVKTAFSNIKI